MSTDQLTTTRAKLRPKVVVIGGGFAGIAVVVSCGTAMLM